MQQEIYFESGAYQGTQSGGRRDISKFQNQRVVGRARRVDPGPGAKLWDRMNFNQNLIIKKIIGKIA